MLSDTIDNILGTNTSKEVREMKKLYRDLDIPTELAELGSSAFEDINIDPESRDAQAAALRMISDLADDGMTAQDEAVLNRIQMEQDQNTRSNQEALMQKAQRLGTMGSGSQMAQNLLNQQQSAQTAALRGLEAAGQASARRQNAVGQMGQQAGALRGQDYGEAANKASARDRINQFNTDSRNRFNQQQFDNRLNKATGQASGIGAGINDKNAKRAALMGAGGSALQTGGQIAGTIGMMMSDVNHKENIVDGSEDIQKFLGQIKPGKYNYKDAKHGEGTFVSPMAQDLEETDLGKDLVINTDEGKIVDYGKGFGLMLSAMANISQRLERAGL